MTLEEFNVLSKKEQDKLVVKSLAWFCVYEYTNPYIAVNFKEEAEIIKIVLGKFRGVV